MRNLADWANVGVPSTTVSGKEDWSSVPQEQLPFIITVKGGNAVVAIPRVCLGALTDAGSVIARINCGSPYGKRFRSQEEALKDLGYIKHIKAAEMLAKRCVEYLETRRMLSVAIGDLDVISGAKPQVYDPNLQCSSYEQFVDFCERIADLRGFEL